MVKIRKDNPAWAVIRGSSIPHGEALFRGFYDFLTPLCIFRTKKSAQEWVNHWENSNNFRIEKIELPFKVES